MRRRLVLCAFSLGALILQAQDPPYRAYAVRDGLPSNTVYCALQDRDGYMWFGTDAGVGRFDGLRFENFTTNDGLSDNEVLDMFEDSQGRIWFLTLNGKLSYQQGGRFRSELNEPILGTIRSASGFTSMAEDPQGRLWFAGMTSELICLYQGRVTQFSVINRCVTPASLGTGQLVHVPGGDPWLVVNHSIHRIRRGAPEFVRCWDAAPAGFPMVGGQGQEIVAYGSRGLVHIDALEERVIVPMDRLPTVKSHRLPYAARNGDIWMPVSSGGVTWVRGPGTGDERMRLLLRTININAAIDDAEGNIWLPTDGHGVVKIDPAQQRIILVRAGEDQKDRSVSSLIATSRGRLFYGTSHGSIHEYLLGGSRTVMPPRDPDVVRDRVRDLQEATDGTLWATTDRWCGRIAPPFTARTIQSAWYYDERATTQGPSLGTGMKSLAVGPDGAVMGSCFGIGLVKDTLGVPTFMFRSTYWPSAQRIYAPFIDAEGDLWFETNEQLHHWRDGVRTDLPELASRSGSRITDIDALSDGTLVIGTAGNGILLIKRGLVTHHFSKRTGLPSDQCRAAVVRHDRILVATDEGAALILTPLGEARTLAWTAQQGLPSEDIQDIDMLGKDLCLATPEGLCILPIAWREASTGPPRVRITRLTTGSTTLADEDTIRITLGAPLEVEVHALTFVHPEAVRYSFRADADSAWASLRNGTFTLDGLPPGEHRYQVRARKIGSSWSAPLSLYVFVVPPWYRTTWFEACVWAAIMMIVLMLVRQGVRRALRHQRVLLERQQALTEERQRIAADMHDDLGADISHLLMLARQSASSNTVNTEDRRNLLSIEAHAEGMMKKIDEVIWSLDPDDDQLLSSLEFLQRHAEAFAGEQGLHFRTRPIEGIQAYHLPGKQRRELYLLLKELLHNVTKHTDARQLRFEVRRIEGAVELVIEDDGRPKERTGGVRNGHGRNNIRMRTENLRADMRTEKLEPVGTRVVVTLWLRRIHQL